jgi:hypothetical protein
MRQHSHSPVLKRPEDRFGQGFVAQITLHLRMGQDIHCAADAQFGKTLAADSSGLSFIDENSACVFHSVGYGCGFAVVERGGSWADNEFLEVPACHLAEANDLHEATSHEFVQTIRISPSAPSPGFEFSRHGIYNNQRCRQRPNDRRSAARGNQVDNGARIRH